MTQNAQHAASQISFLNLVKSTFLDSDESENFSKCESVDGLWNELPVLLKLPMEAVTEQLATACNLPFVHSISIPFEVMVDFPVKFIQKNTIAPFKLEGDIYKIALSNPFDDDVINQIKFITNQKVEFYLCSPSVIEESLHVYFSNSDPSKLLESGVLVIQEGHPAASSEHAVVALASKILQNAVNTRASDVHIQPFLGGGEIRQRIDGILHRVALIPDSVYQQLCRYFKAQSGMDPFNDRVTQDGRLTLDIGLNDFELRMSILPARGGESLVIRLLNQHRTFNLSDSGMAIAEMQKMRELLDYPSGIILMTGPTGSGKTSTLYSLLGELNSSEKKIVTIENPVEYTLPGICQVEINAKAGLSFASSLRSALRQDPEIIMLGEIRDSETAKVATQAALTGHLVLSTVHTNDSISAITRLQDLGVTANVIADSVIGIVSQRLCRKLCEHCRQPVDGELEPQQQAFKDITMIAPGYRKGGCDKCDFTGYWGRLPITEILHIESQSQRQLISSGRSDELAEQKNKLNKLTAISASAARHIISGETTITEVTRVIGHQFWRLLAEEYDKPIPDINLKTDGMNTGKHSGAMLWLSEQAMSEELAQQLYANWFSFYHVSDSEQAKDLLHTHSEIVSVVVNIPERLTDTEVIDYIHKARIDMAWSRLPALLLLPEGRDHLEKELGEKGATSPCLMKPFTAEQIVEHIKTSLSSDR